MAGAPLLQGGLQATEADRAALAEVLAGVDFQAARWRGEELRRWLADAWERLTAALGTAEAEQWAGLGRLVFFAAVVVAGLLFWRASRRRRRTARVTGAGPDRPAPRPEVAGAVVADGELALAAGDLPGAVRLALLAAIGAARRRLGGGAAEALTGGELAGRLADDAFTGLVRLHERTAYGLRPVSSAEAAGALAVAARLAARAGASERGVTG
jgi:hypothetical protein